MALSIEEIQKEAGLRSIADKIVKRISVLDQTVEENQGRWAWELLQNAKDSVAEEENGTVSVQIELKEGSVEFRHNGSHFQMADIVGIIDQISSKEVEEDQVTKKTGRFGTGFLTTHLLSKVVEISGVVEDEDNCLKNFKFTLDRRATSTKHLIPCIRRTWEEYRESTDSPESVRSENEFNTSFCYRLDTESQKKVALVGIKEFSELLPFVLTFIPSIDKVEIIGMENLPPISFKNGERNPKSHITTIEKNVFGAKEPIFMLHASDQDVSIATAIEKCEEGYRIKDISGQPKLFCDFPLIGTEKFPFPIIINSFSFNPQEERNGIWLKSEDSIKVTENRRILKAAVLLYKQLMNAVETDSFFEIYHMASTKIWKTSSETINLEWHLGHVRKPLRETIYNAKIVEARSDTEGKKAPKNTLFPDKSLSQKAKEKLWEFIREYNPEQVCKKEHINGWQEISWKEWKEETYESLIESISKQEQLSALVERLCIGEKDTLKWLDSFGSFLLEEEEGNITLLDKFPVMPSKSGSFEGKIYLYNDKIQDESLIYILELLGDDWNKKLLHEEISFFREHIGDKTKKDIAREITDSLKAVIKKQPHEKDSKSIEAINLLSEWFETNPEDGKKLFSELYAKRAEMFMNTVKDKDSLYKIMRSKADLSKLAEAIGSDTAIVEKIQNAQKLEILLTRFGAKDLSELEGMLVVAKSALSDESTRIEITEDVLASLGITTSKELEEALKNRDIAAKFIHSSTPEVEMFIAAQKKIARAKRNVIKYLQSRNNYDCSGVEETAPTILGGIEKDGRSITVVVRPSDNKEVIIYYSSERDALDLPGAELWTDNGVQPPKILTFGKVLKTTKITRIPVE